MKICIVGAGSIGGLLGVRLGLAGQDVTVIARGAHLAAIREQGLRLRTMEGEELCARAIGATDRIAEAGRFDLVVLGVKSHQLPPIANELPALFHDDTIVLTTQNGIPWWYFLGTDGPHAGTPIRAVDPDGEVARHIEPRRIVGCISYPAAEIAEPGVIRHVEGTRFPVGEIDGTRSERAAQLSALLAEAGFKSPILDDIRSELWLKLWGNLTFNPVSALTHATLQGICEFAPARELAARMMEEAQVVAGRLGVSFRVSLERRIAGAEAVGQHKTSMLQDVEAGKALETEALLGAVVELGRLTQTPTPHLDAVYACVKLLEKSMLEAGGGVRLEAPGSTPSGSVEPAVDLRRRAVAAAR